MSLPGLEIGLSAPNDRLIADMRQAASVIEQSTRAMAGNIDQFGFATDRATYAGNKMIKAVQDQIDAFGKSSEALKREAAVRNGVGVQYDALTERLNRMRDAEKSFAAEVEATTPKLRAHGVEAKAAGGHVEELGFKTARSRTELIVLAHELSQGNYKKFGGSMMVLAEQTGVASLAFTAAGLAILGVGAAVGLAGYALIKGASEQKAFRDAVVLTGGSAGLTSDSLLQLAHTAAETGGSLTSAKEAMLLLANSGKFTAAEILTIGTAATEMEHVAGVAVAETVKQFEELAKKPAEASAKLNEQYHYLTQSVYEQILALEKQGKAVEAAKLAEDTYAEAVKQRAGMLDSNLGAIERWWNKIKKAVNDAKDAVGEFGKKSTAQSTLTGLQKDLGDMDWKKSGSASQDALNRADLLKKIAAAQYEVNREQLRAAETGMKQKFADEAIHGTAILAAEDAKGKQKSALAIALALNAEAEAQVRLNSMMTGEKSDFISEEAIAARRERTIRLHSLKGKGAGAADDPTNTIAADQIAQVKAQFALEDEIYKARLSMLDDYHRKEGLSDTDFYAGRKVAIAEILAAKRAEYEKESDILANKENRSAKDEASTQKQLDAMFADYTAFAQKIGDVQIKDNLGSLDATAKQYKDIYDAILKTGGAEQKTLETTLKAQKLHNAEIGKSKEQKELEKLAIEDADTAQLQSDADFLQGVLDRETFDDKSRAAYVIRLTQMQEELDLRHKISAAYKEGAEKEAIAQADKDLQKMTDSIDKSLSTAILKGFTGAKGFAQDFANSLKGLFAKLVLQPILSPVSSALASVGTSVSSGFSASMLGSAFSAATSTFGAGVADGAMAVFSGSATEVASAAIATIGETTAASLGTLAGVAGPYALAAIAAYELIKSFSGGEMRYGGGYNTTPGGAISLAGGPSGGEITAPQTRSMIQGTADALQATLKAFGSTATVGNFTAGGESSKYGKANVFAGGSVNGVGFGMGGADNDPKVQLGNADPAQVTAALTLQLKRALLEGIQAAGIGGVVTEYLGKLGDLSKLTTEQADAAIKQLNDMQQLTTAIKALPFEQLKGASLETVTAIAAATGGMTALGTKLGSYYSDYYTQEEKNAKVSVDVSKALGDVNIAMPKSRDAFRALVEAQDLTTESGRKAYGALINVEGAFASITPAANAAALRALSIELMTKTGDAEGALQATRADSLKGLTEEEIAYKKAIYAAETYNTQHALDIGLLTALGKGEQAVQATRADVLKGLAGEQKIRQTEIFAAEDAAKKRGLEIQLLTAMGNAEGALAATRAEVLKGLLGDDLALQVKIFAAEDAARTHSLSLGLLAAKAAFSGPGSVDEAISKTAVRTDSLTAAFNDGDRAILKLTYAYQDATEAQKNYNTALSAFNSATSAVNSAMSAAASTFKGFETAVSTAEKAVQAERDKINTAYQAALSTQNTERENLEKGWQAASDKVASAQQVIIDLNVQAATAMRGFATSIRNFITQMATTPLGGMSTAQQKNNLQAQFDSTAALAKGGDQTAAGALTGIAGNLLKITQDTSTDAVSFAIDAAKIRAALTDVATGLDARATATASTVLTPMEKAVASLSDALNTQAQWTAAVTAAGGSFEVKATDISEAYNRAAQATQTWLNAAALTGTTLTTKSESLVEGFNTASDTLKAAIEELKKANAIKGDIELRMAGSLDTFTKQMDALVKAIADLGKAQDALAAATTANAAAKAAVTTSTAAATATAASTSTSSPTATGSVAALMGNTTVRAAILGDYNEFLHRKPTDADIAYWTAAVFNDGDGEVAGLNAIREAIANSPEAKAIPHFAMGGDFMGGIRIVGENGPELEATGPSRIFNASQTASMLNGSMSGDEMSALVQEVRGMRDDMKRGDIANVQATKDQTRILRDVTQGGNAILTTAAA